VDFNWQGLLVSFGALAAILLTATVAAVYLGRKHNKIVGGRWHHKLAHATVFVVAIHMLLAFRQITP